MLTTTLSDLESSNLDLEEECDGDGNYLVFMTITLVDSKDELSGNYSVFMKHCLRIVASILKLLRM